MKNGRTFWEKGEDIDNPLFPQCFLKLSVLVKKHGIAQNGNVTTMMTTVRISTGYYLDHTKLEVNQNKYSIACIQRPLKGSNESGLLQQVVFKCRFN